MYLYLKNCNIKDLKGGMRNTTFSIFMFVPGFPDKSVARLFPVLHVRQVDRERQFEFGLRFREAYIHHR